MKKSTAQASKIEVWTFPILGSDSVACKNSLNSFFLWFYWSNVGDLCEGNLSIIGELESDEEARNKVQNSTNLTNWSKILN